MALRDGGRFLISRAEGIPCTAASVGQAASAASAAVKTDLPPGWLAGLINELLGEDAEPERT